jgi:hypothetical protein
MVQKMNIYFLNDFNNLTAAYKNEKYSMISMTCSDGSKNEP